MNFTAQPNLSRIAEDQTEGMREGLPRLPALVRTPSPRVAIKVKGKILFVDLGEVVAVQAEGNYVLLHRNASSYMLRESISALEKKLEPYGFIRIHRSHIVNLERVAKIEAYTKDSKIAVLRDGTQLPVSRAGYARLKALLGES